MEGELCTALLGLFYTGTDVSPLFRWRHKRAPHRRTCIVYVYLEETAKLIHLYNVATMALFPCDLPSSIYSIHAAMVTRSILDCFTYSCDVEKLSIHLAFSRSSSYVAIYME